MTPARHDLDTGSIKQCMRQLQRGNGLWRIFLVSSSENIVELRNEILRLHDFHVQSAVYSAKAIDKVLRVPYHLVLIEVESDVQVQSAQDLCDTIKKAALGSMSGSLQPPCKYREQLSRRDYPGRIQP
jgi:hypothetical protein